MGNKNSSKSINNNVENLKLCEEIKKGICKYLKSDKSTNECLTNINNKNFNFNSIKLKKVEKSNLNENLQSNNILDFCLDITSNLINKTLNHEVNTTFYKSILINKISENNSDSDILNQQNNLIINWIYQTLLNDKAGKYDNWIPEINENSWLDKLNNVSSIHANSDMNISSYQLSEKDISINDKKFKIKRKKNTRNKDKKSNDIEFNTETNCDNILTEKFTKKNGGLCPEFDEKENLPSLKKQNSHNIIENSKKQKFFSPKSKVKRFF